MKTEHELAIRRVKDLTGIEWDDPYTQDWEYEVPEQYRTLECLRRYVGLIPLASGDVLCRKILMSLILDISNDHADELPEDIWEIISAELRRFPRIYADLIDRWTLSEEPLDNCFAITPRIRDLRP